MDFIKKIQNKNLDNTFISGVNSSFASFVLARYQKALGSPLIVILKDDSQCESFKEDLLFFNPSANVRAFLDYRQDVLKSDSSHYDLAASRIKILYDIAAGEFDGILLTTFTALSGYTVPSSDLLDFVDIHGVNEDIPMESIVQKLVSSGYKRTSLVEEPGDFAVRGGIIDFFSPFYEDPVRMEFFGDTIESIRFFSVNSQMKKKDLDEVMVLPVSEVLIKNNEQEVLFNRIRETASDLGLDVAHVRTVIERIKTEGNFQGIEQLLPLFYSEKTTLIDYFDLKVPVSAYDLGMSVSEYEKKEEADRERYEHCLKSGVFRLPFTILNKDKESLLKSIQSRPFFEFGTVASPSKENVFVKLNDNTWVKSELKSKIGSDYPLAPLVSWVEENVNSGYATLIGCSTKTQAERLSFLLKPYGLSMEIKSDLIMDSLPAKKGYAAIAVGRISEGFVHEESGLAIITEDEIFGIKSRRRKKVRKLASERIYSLNELAYEDIVVHADHGLGRYMGLEKIDLANITGEFAVIVYQDEDRLYIPADRINIIQKYVGKDPALCSLDRLGGKDWSKAKEKAKKKAEKIAKELLSIYAKRQMNEKSSFSSPDENFRDFEASFPYEETEGQAKAIDDVISDMMGSRPMDRLVCGDVGYGKTEVAIRAAFKACQDGRQVAVLVPTTVLAEQHYQTFKERFDGYGVKIAVLNRFRTRKEQNQILKDLASGDLNIVIGTHRLIQKDVSFLSLGLLIIDEEQRFGVKHKEKIRGLKASVDVLTLTATPIPRTLHMSLAGIRDMSIISTPPEARQPIMTYISEFDETVIKEAVIKEIKRGGQVYFVHNNISTIDNICSFLLKSLPNIRVGKAHGRMPERELEDEMKKFIHKEIDILVCTTIVESGLDIPDANTMIVNRADRFGLSQLYQLRGRIGRGKKQAYAYLFVPKENKLTKDSEKRLKVLMQHSDLGAGFQLAMGDLQIRGAGDLLGASQSGHVDEIGYELFVELLEAEVSRLKGEEPKESLEPEINVEFSAYIPESYIPDSDQRMILYRRLTKLDRINKLSAFKKELLDRYGRLPKEAENLLLKIMLRILCISCGVAKLDINKGLMVCGFSKKHLKNHEKLIELVKKHGSWSFMGDSKIKILSGSKKTSVSFAKRVLQEIAQSVSES